MFLKKFIIFFIRLYQKTPTTLHNRCRYIPTCSEYMILSIEKYGVFVGIKKGLNRIKKCRYPHGGEDWP
jgi:hypothetical protein